MSQTYTFWCHSFQLFFRFVKGFETNANVKFPYYFVVKKKGQLHSKSMRKFKGKINEDFFRADLILLQVCTAGLVISCGWTVPCQTLDTRISLQKCACTPNH